MKKVRKHQVDEPSAATLEEIPQRPFHGAVRGKYAARYAEGTNLVLLDRDVAEAFPDAASVNNALRAIVALRKVTVVGGGSTRRTARRTGTRGK